jgi:hypothetical protein
VNQVLRDSPLTGTGGRQVVEGERLADLLGLLEREGRHS